MRRSTLPSSKKKPINPKKNSHIIGSHLARTKKEKAKSEMRENDEDLFARIRAEQKEKAAHAGSSISEPSAVLKITGASI